MNRYVADNEPETKTYYFVIPLEYEENHLATHFLWAFEIYSDANASEEVHNKSAAFDKFVSSVAPITLTRFDMEYYEDVGGFHSRRESGPAGIVYRTWIRTTPGHRPAVCEAFVNLARDREVNQPDTLTFLVLKNRDNHTDLMVLQRFTTKNAWKEDMKSETCTRVFSGLKDCVAQLDRRGFLETRNNFFTR